MESTIIERLKEKETWLNVALVFNFVPFIVLKDSETVDTIFDFDSEKLAFLTRDPIEIKIDYEYFYYFSYDYAAMRHKGTEIKNLMVDISNNLIIYDSIINEESYYIIEQGIFAKYYQNSGTGNFSITFDEKRIKYIGIIETSDSRDNDEPLIKYIFNKNGEMENVVSKKFKDEKEPIIKRYSDDSIKSITQSFRANNLLNSLFYLIKEYDEKGKILKLKSKLYDLNLISFTLTYHPNGQMKKFISYEKNLISGFNINFHLSGKVHTLHTFLFGKLSGPAFTYDENGVLVNEKYYLNDLLCNFYREFEKGEIKCQGMYEIIDNKSVKKGYWLERENGILNKVFYGPSTELLYFPPAIL